MIKKVEKEKAKQARALLEEKKEEKNGQLLGKV